MRRSILVAVVGLVLLVGGGAVALVRPVSFGWTSYTPLTEPSTPGVIVLDGPNVLALLVAVVGLVLVAGAVGFRLAARRPPASETPRLTP